MIVGADILMGQNAILPYPPYNEALNVLKLQNGVYDDLLLSRNADKDYGKYNLDMDGRPRRPFMRLLTVIPLVATCATGRNRSARCG